MAKDLKDLLVKTGVYTNKQGETKGEFTKIGVVLSNSNGEYIMLDPAINLAGMMIKQNSMSGENRTNVMVSIFDRDNQQGATQAPQGQNQQGQSPQQQAQPKPANDFDDDIPF